MPELPEVETLARIYQPLLAGRTILKATVLWPRSVACPEVERFCHDLQGQQIQHTGRRAKFFLLTLSNASLVFHLRMSGDLRLDPQEKPAQRHDRILLELSGGETFAFHDPRKFGRAWLLQDTARLFSRLGPEPLSDDFTPAWLQAALAGHRRQIKPLLLDQAFLAGLGNIYTDEALNLARLHPCSPANRMNPAQVLALWEAIRATLQEGIRRNGTSIDWVYRGGEFQNHLRVYGRTGQPCPACGTPVEHTLVGQRSTHYCPQCQVFPVQ